MRCRKVSELVAPSLSLSPLSLFCKLGQAQGRGMVRAARSHSSPPRPVAAQAAAEVAAEAARVAAASAAFAAEVAAEAAALASTDAELDTAAVEWPPRAAESGVRFWFARGHPELEDGIYVYKALVNRGVNPERSQAVQLLHAWKTPEPTLRRAQGTGAEGTKIFWR